MNIKKCNWCLGHKLYETYHDQEWGVPVYNDQVLFEFLMLETFQSGLSWITILKKRENFKEAFNNFNYLEIAKYNQDKINSLLKDSGIVRHQLKIKATIGNAQAFIKIRHEFKSFSNYIWKFVNNKPIQNNFISLSEIPANTALSHTISKDLKKRGFKFVGSTVIYAYMQAIGMVNDHLTSCPSHKKLI